MVRLQVSMSIANVKNKMEMQHMVFVKNVDLGTNSMQKWNETKWILRGFCLRLHKYYSPTKSLQINNLTILEMWSVVNITSFVWYIYTKYGSCLIQRRRNVVAPIYFDIWPLGLQAGQHRVRITNRLQIGL